MSQDLYNTWQTFAKAASVEHDSEKLAHLVQQLNRALAEEDQRTRPMQQAGSEI
jgi:hypothetical protein